MCVIGSSETLSFSSTFAERPICERGEKGKRRREQKNGEEAARVGGKVRIKSQEIKVLTSSESKV